MPGPAAHADQQKKRMRDLRLRIGRLRRRIDGRAHAAAGQARLLLSWRTYARRWPGTATVAALGAGLVLSAGLRRRQLSRWLGRRLIRRAARHVAGQLWWELAQIWADATPTRAAESKGADDGRA